MSDHFSQITFVLACTGFKTSKPQPMSGTHPISMLVGERGCEAIIRDPNGGFDILGEDGQSFWVADHNVVWARKAKPALKAQIPNAPPDCSRCGKYSCGLPLCVTCENQCREVVDPVADTERVPVVVPEVVHPGEPVESCLVGPEPKKRGRPKGKK